MSSQGSNEGHKSDEGPPSPHDEPQFLAVVGSMSRQSSTMSNVSVSSINSNSSTSSKLKKKKALIWAGKHDATAVVIGPVESVDSFRDLIACVKDRCGEIKSHYFRDEQACGFVYFHTEEGATNCKSAMDGFTFQGTKLKACEPSQYFENEEDAFPEQHPARRTKSLLGSPSPAPAHAHTEPTATLVIKNLCFGLKQEKLLDYMARLRSPPVSVSYHYDGNGLFRGVAFAKYPSAEQAAESLNELQGQEIDGRKLRVEFKRRSCMPPHSLQPMASVLSAQPSFDSPNRTIRLDDNAAAGNHNSANSSANSSANNSANSRNLERPPSPISLSISSPNGRTWQQQPTAPLLPKPPPPPVMALNSGSFKGLAGSSSSPPPPPGPPGLGLGLGGLGLGGGGVVVLRSGGEFEALEPQATGGQVARVPPPLASHLDLGSAPMIRAGLEFP